MNINIHIHMIIIIIIIAIIIYAYTEIICSKPDFSHGVENESLPTTER